MEKNVIVPPVAVSTPPPTETPLADDGNTVVASSAPVTIADLKAASIVRLPNRSRIPFGEAIGKGESPADAPYISGFVKMTFDDGFLIAAEIEGQEVIFRSMKLTTIVGTEMSVLPKTLKLTAVVRIFKVTPISAPLRKGYRRPLDDCKLGAMVIQLPPDEGMSTEGEKHVVGITVKDGNSPSIVRVIVEDLKNGFLLPTLVFPNPTGHSPLTNGQMYWVCQYQTRPFFDLEETVDGVRAVRNDTARRGKTAIYDPQLISDHDLQLIYRKGSGPDVMEPEKYVRAVLAADAALRARIDRELANERTLRGFKPKFFRIGEEFQCHAEIDSCWTLEDNDGCSWTVGTTLVARFPGSTNNSSTEVIVTISGAETLVDKTRVTLAFPIARNHLLKAASETPVRIDIGPSDQVDFSAWRAIRAGFHEFRSSSLFPQYAGGTLSGRKESKGETKGFGLDDSQVSLVSSILEEKGISVGVGPPGSGKTAAIGMSAKLLLDETKMVVIASASNIAVEGALSAIGTSDGIRATRLMSRTAEQTASAEEKRLVVQHQARQYQDWIPKSEKTHESLRRLRGQLEQTTQDMHRTTDPAAIVDYLEKIHDEEKALADAFMAVYRPNIVGATIALLLRFSTVLKEATHLIVDEASQLAPYQLLAVLCALTKLQKVVLIGDPLLFRPFCPFPDHADVARTMKTSDMERLADMNPGRVSVLTQIYRCHRKITENIIRPVYSKINVVSPPNLGDKNAAERMRLPRAADGTPCVFFNVHSAPQVGVSIEEALAIQNFLKKVQQRNPRVQWSDFVVLVYHRRQRALITTMVPRGVAVRTIDGFQGQQAKFVLLSTMKNCRSRNATDIRRTLQFVSNKERSLVAVSRSTDGLYVFGNTDQLAHTEFFETLLRWARRAGAIIREDSEAIGWRQFINISHR